MAITIIGWLVAGYYLGMYLKQTRGYEPNIEVEFQRQLAKTPHK